MHLKDFKFALILALTAAPFFTNAQQEIMLSQMTDKWQYSSINPAFFPENKRIAVGLPAFGVDARHSGSITLGDFFHKENGKTILDFGNIVAQLEPENELSYRHRIETVSFGLRLPGPGKTAISVSHAIRFNSNTTYSKEMVQLFWEGNAQFIGQTIEVAPSSNSFDWHEVGLGVSRSFGKLRAGARVKYLAGISAFISDPAARTISVYTDPDIYQLKLNTDYGFYSAGIVSAIDTNGLGFKLVTNELNNQFSGANSGLAFDLGISYKLTDRLTVNASVLDWGGSLRWEAADYFHTKGSFDYNGATIPGDQIINGSSNLDFSTKLDSLNDIFKFSKTTTDFSTAIPARYYVGAKFELTKKIAAAGTFFQEQSDTERKTAFGASLQFKPFKWLGFGILYATNKQKKANFGGQISLSAGPAQFFLLSDNLSGAFSPRQSPSVHFRTGLAILLSLP